MTKTKTANPAKTEEKVNSENLPSDMQAPPPAETSVQFDDGLGNFGMDDLVIPRLTLNHEQPKEAVGCIYCKVTGDIWHNGMVCTVIKAAKSRVMFPENFDRDNDPLCRSHDNVVPANDIEDQDDSPYATCAECPHSKWIYSEGKTSGRPDTPPACKECWNFLIIGHDSYMPAWITFTGVSIAPAKRLITALKLRGMARKIPVWRMQVRFQVAYDERPKGNSYIPDFSDIKPIEDPEMKADMEAFMKQLSGKKFEDSLEEAPADDEF